MLSDCVCVCVCVREREREAGGLFFQRKPVPSIYSTSSWQAPKQGRLPWRWADFRIESLFGCAKHPAVCGDPSVLFLSALTRELWLSPWAPQWCNSGWSRWRMLFLPGVAMAAWASSCGDVAVRMLPCSTSASGSLRAPKPRTASALALPWLFQSRWYRSSTVCCLPRLIEASQVMLVVKNLPANARGVRDTGLIPGSGRSPGGGHGNPLQYSCLENSLDRGAWWATVRRIAQSWMWLKWLSMHTGLCCCCRQVTPIVSDSVRPHRRQPTRLPSLGFSRQEYWSGLPFPSPEHESEKSFSCVRLFLTPWTAAHQAPPPMGFSRQEHWSGMPLPPPTQVYSSVQTEAKTLPLDLVSSSDTQSSLFRTSKG